MRPARTAAVAAAVALSAAGCVTAPAPQLQADHLTVSGREPAPRADASAYKGRLRVAEVKVSEAATRQMHMDPAALEAAVTAAVNKSLANFGYLAAGNEADAEAVTVEIAPLLMATGADSTRATAVLRLRPTDGSDAQPCLTYEATGEFTSLSPAKSGAGHRVATLAAITLMAAAGGAPSAAAQASTNLFATQQWSNASAHNRALNARREVGAAEGVAPGHTPQDAARHAGANALRRAMTDLITHLGSAGVCRPG